MELLYIIVGIVLFGLILIFIQTKKQKNAPYFKIKRKLEEDLQQASFTSDWKKRQELNLQILWLNVLKDAETTSFLPNNNKESENDLLAKLTEDELVFPVQWSLDNENHIPFIQEIVSEYGKILAENDYKGFYKPVSILPYPKQTILKAIYYLFDYLNLEKPLFIIKEKDKYAESLNAVKYALHMQFVDPGNVALPKDSRANFRMGQKFSKILSNKEEANELLMVDWLDDIQWIVKAIRYADNSQFAHALVCFKKAKELSPFSENLRISKGIVYQSIAEHYGDKFNQKLEYKYMKKAAKLGNLEAQHWLSQNSNN